MTSVALTSSVAEESALAVWETKWINWTKPKPINGFEYMQIFFMTKDIGYFNLVIIIVYSWPNSSFELLF